MGTLKQSMEVEAFREYLRTKLVISGEMTISSANNYVHAIKRFVLKKNRNGEDNNFTKEDDWRHFLIQYTCGTKDNGFKNQEYFLYAVKHFLNFKFNKTDADAIIAKMPKPIKKIHTKRGKYLNKEQLKKVISYLEHDKHQVIMWILIATGIRIGDCLRTHKKDFIEEDGKLKINITGKGHKEQVVWIHNLEIKRKILNYLKFNKLLTEYAFLELNHRGGKLTKFVSKETAIGKDIIEKIEVLEDNAIKGFKEGDIINMDEQSISQKKILMFLEEQMKNKSIKLIRKKFIYKILNEDKVVESNRHEFYDDLKSAVNNIGIRPEDFSCHDIRRCYAKEVWKKTKDINLLKDQLNHSSADTTLKYLRGEGELRKENDRKIQEDILELSDVEV